MRTQRLWLVKQPALKGEKIGFIGGLLNDPIREIGFGFQKGAEAMWKMKGGTSLGKVYRIVITNPGDHKKCLGQPRFRCGVSKFFN